MVYSKYKKYEIHLHSISFDRMTLKHEQEDDQLVAIERQMEAELDIEEGAGFSGGDGSKYVSSGVDGSRLGAGFSGGDGSEYVSSGIDGGRFGAGGGAGSLNSIADKRMNEQDIRDELSEMEHLLSVILRYVQYVRKKHYKSQEKL